MRGVDVLAGRVVRDVAEAIRQHMNERGYPPSIRELAQVFDVSKTTIHNDLRRLEAEGVIERQPGRNRAIRVKENR